MNTRKRAIAGLLIAMIFVSSNGLLIKLSTWDALALNGARSLIAALVLWAFLRRPHFTWSRAQLGGAAAYALMLITFVQATRWTTAANAIFLQFTAPVWVALLGFWLLGERPRRSDWITIAAVLVGMLLFFGGGLAPQDTWGNLLALFSGLCMAVLTIALRAQKDGSPTETVLLGNLLAAGIGLPSLLFGDQAIDAREIGIVVFLGVFQLGLPFIIITLAIKQLSALESILIQTLEPLLNPVWVYLGIGEVPSLSAIAGAAIVFTAVTLNTVLHSRRPGPAEKADPMTH